MYIYIYIYIYIQEKNSAVFENKFNFNKSIKNLTDSGSKVNMIENSYAPKTDVEIEDKKKRVVSILNKIKQDWFDIILLQILLLNCMKNLNVIKVIKQILY